MQKISQQAAENELIDAWTLFQVALTKKGAYPIQQLTNILDNANQYSKIMTDSEFLHKSIADLFGSFRAALKRERKLVPPEALSLADRIESIIFTGEDPYFEGD